jgi:hypothetical protein
VVRCASHTTCLAVLAAAAGVGVIDKASLQDSALDQFTPFTGRPR